MAVCDSSGADLPTLTALRFLAAALVFATHADLGGPLAPAGRSGVSFFFILSGCVLAWSSNGRVRSRPFWWRRAARLFPAYLVAWLAGILVTAWESGWSAAIGPRTIPGWLLVQAWDPATAGHFAVNGVSWSLSCELLFYLLFPSLLGAVDRCRVSVVKGILVGALVVAVGLPALVRSGDPNYFWTYIFPPARLPEFVAGIALGVLLRKGVRCPVGLPVALVIGGLAWIGAVLGPVWAASVAIPVLPWALVIMAAATADLQQRGSTARLRLPVRLGEISYAFYLVHQLVLRVLTASGWRLDEWVYAVLGLVGSLAAAAALHLLVERPVRDFLLTRGRRRPLTGS